MKRTFDVTSRRLAQLDGAAGVLRFRRQLRCAPAIRVGTGMSEQVLKDLPLRLDPRKLQSRR
jgi:hypothetical protein